MQTIPMRYRTVNSTLLAIILTLAVVMAAIPIIPAHGALDASISMDIPVFTVGDGDAERTFTVDNKGTTDISQINIIGIPKATSSAAGFENVKFTSPHLAGFIGGANVQVAGIGPWTVKLWNFEKPDGTILPVGASARFGLVFDPEDSVISDNHVDIVDLSITIKDTAGATVSSTIRVYQVPSGAAYDLDPTTATVTAGKEKTLTANATAGSDALIGLYGKIIIVTGTSKKITITPSPFITGSNGKVSVTFKDTKAETVTLKASAGTSGTYTSGFIPTESAQVTVTVTPDSPTKMIVCTPLDDDDYLITYIRTTSVAGCTVSLADQYGNPVPAYTDVIQYNVTLTATTGTLTPTSVSIPQGNDESGPFTYTPKTDYGTFAMISAVMTIPSGKKYAGTYSGNSKQLATSTFATLVTVTPSSDTTKGAGKEIEIVATLSVVQKYVPITFSIDKDSSSTAYVGTLSVTNGVTDELGVLKTKLKVSTKTGNYTKVKATVSAPETCKPSNTFSALSGLITTVGGDPTKLNIKTYEDAECTKTRNYITTGGALYVKVFLVDAWDNDASSSIAVDLGITLTATAGQLQTSILIIPPTAYVSSSAGLYVAPATGQIVTLTASTFYPGIASDTHTVEVIVLEPTITITDPATDTSVVSNVAIDKYIAGYATISKAQPAGTAVAYFMYSLDGSANVTVPIVKVDTTVTPTKYHFNFSVTLSANATHKVMVYAKDSAPTPKTGSAMRTIAVAPTAPVVGTGTFTPSAPKLLNSAGTEVTSVGVGTQFYIQVTLTSNVSNDLSVYVIAQIKDQTGKVAAIGLTAADVKGSATKNVPIAFLGLTSGTYTVTIFVWSSITAPTALAPTTTFNIIVS